MKIILSRKGFDSANGYVPSPIFPSGKIISLPIPDSRSPIKYDDIYWNGQNLGELVYQLTDGQITGQHKAHLDPDLRKESLPDRPKVWRGLFGQVGAAQGHLERLVEPGDLFLFFGWFKQIRKTLDGVYTYSPSAPDCFLAGCK